LSNRLPIEVGEEKKAVVVGPNRRTIEFLVSSFLPVFIGSFLDPKLIDPPLLSRIGGLRIKGI